MCIGDIKNVKFYLFFLTLLKIPIVFLKKVLIKLVFLFSIETLEFPIKSGYISQHILLLV